jgi:Domain of Unknown Function (DUF1080)
MNKYDLSRFGLRGALLALGVLLGVARGDDEPKKQEPPAIVGRWDITVRSFAGDYPSWLEVRQSGYRTLVGTFVGRTGSARPISRVDFERERVRFTVPPQWERRQVDLRYEGQLKGDALQGETTDDKGALVTWTARRAPALKRDRSPQWGEPIQLFNERDLTGWRPKSEKAQSGWSARDGLLANAFAGTDLVTDGKFTDFKLHAEFRYPRGSNSGIYLRGRYEVQIEDNYGQEPECHGIGAIYGFLTPSVNAAKPAGQWQSVDVTLVGRVVSVSLNGERIIDRQTIPGITGGALDSDEGSPGPIMLQGDHGPIDFRRLILTPGH